MLLDPVHISQQASLDHSPTLHSSEASLGTGLDKVRELGH